MLRRELADLPLQLGNAAGVLHRRQRYSAAANAGKRKVTLGSPLSAPAFQQMRTHLVFARHLCVSGTCVQRPHGGDFEITTVNSSGQIHFLAPFNVFGPLTPCLIFGVHSRCFPSASIPPLQWTMCKSRVASARGGMPI